MSLASQVPSTGMHSRAWRFVVPAQVRVVAQLPWLDEMRYCEQGAEHDADAADNNVGDAEEGVLAAHDGACADYYGFCAAVFGYGEIWMVLELLRVKVGEAEV